MTKFIWVFLCSMLAIDSANALVAEKITYFQDRDPGKSFKCVSRIGVGSLTAQNGLAKCSVIYGIEGILGEKFAATFEGSTGYPIDKVCQGEGCLEYSAAVIFTGGIMFGRIATVKKRNSRALKAAVQEVTEACGAHVEQVKSVACSDVIIETEKLPRRRSAR